MWNQAGRTSAISFSSSPRCRSNSPRVDAEVVDAIFRTVLAWLCFWFLSARTRCNGWIGSIWRGDELGRRKAFSCGRTIQFCGGNASRLRCLGDALGLLGQRGAADVGALGYF